MTGLEKARAQAALNRRLRAEGKLAPLPSRKKKESHTEMQVNAEAAGLTDAAYKRGVAEAAKPGRPPNPAITPEEAGETLDQIARAMPAEEPVSLADLGLGPTEEFRVDDILSNDEIEAIKARAEKEVLDEQRKSRARSFLEMAKDEARRKHGAMPEDEVRQRELEEKVSIRVVLPSLRTPTGRELPPDPIILDQKAYFHGRTYTVTRAVGEYLEYLMSEARKHMSQIDGRSRTYYNEQRGTMMYQGGEAAGGAR